MARTMSEKVRAFVLDALAAQYGRNCRFCGTDKDLTPDHINFDTTDMSWDNLQILCHPCNSAKHRTAKTIRNISTNGAHSSQLIPHAGTQGGINEEGEGGGRGGRHWTEVEEVHRQAEGAEGQKETYLSISYRRRFRECLITELSKRGEWDKQDALASCCNYAGCVPKTGATYLFMLTSSLGPVMERPGDKGTMLRLRPNHDDEGKQQE